MYVGCFRFFGFIGGPFCRLGSFRLLLGWIFSFHFWCFPLSVVFVLSSVLWFSSFGVVCVCVPGFFGFCLLRVFVLSSFGVSCVCVPGFSGFCLLRVWMGLVLLLSGCVFVGVLCCGVLLFWLLVGRPPSVLSCAWLTSVP